MSLKNFKPLLLGALIAAALASAVGAAPVVVTPGSNAGYLYFPSASSGLTGGTPPGGGAPSVTVDGMQLASTLCLTSSGTVSLPSGFVSGYIQVILVSGGEGDVTGGITSITHADIGTVSATGAGSGGGGAFAGFNGAAGEGGGGGGGGYLGGGGDGGDGTENSAGGGGGASGGNGGTAPIYFTHSGGAGGGYPGDGQIAAGIGQGTGYGSGIGKGGTYHYKLSNSTATAPTETRIAPSGSMGLGTAAPASIPCSNAPAAGDATSMSPGKGGTGGSGFGAGGGGRGGHSYQATPKAERGGNSGGIKAFTFKYSSGPMTVVVGTGGSGGTRRGAGAPGVVALRFIPN